jgi:prevent-host-death family protein
MRSVTIAEAEQNFAEVLNSADSEPVRILRDGRDLILISADEFEQNPDRLHSKRVRALLESIDQCSREAAANGFTDDMLHKFLR